jgi:hypothetical protein
MHIIGDDNYQEALDAVRDILMMYVVLADAFLGFGHNADCHVRFDPFKFVDAQVQDTGQYYVDLELLRAGSAIAILCAFYNEWTEEKEPAGQPLTKRFQAADEKGQLTRFPDIEKVITEAIRRNSAPLDDEWIELAVAPIYRKYVLGYFVRLSKLDRFARKPS